MATGDTVDMVQRMRRVLPVEWFSDDAPILTGLLSGLGAVWASIYALIGGVGLMTRLATVNGPFLDLAALDYRATTLQRRAGESDTAFRGRLLPIFVDKATRAAVIARLKALTGHTPTVFEPSRPADIGGYGVAMGYGAAGAYGSLSLPYQCFIQVDRPVGAGIPYVSGWGSSVGGWGVGSIEWGSLSQEAPHVSDADIYAAVADTIAAGTIAWVALGGSSVGTSVGTVNWFGYLDEIGVVDGTTSVPVLGLIGVDD